jgi:integral membrane protein (TIGR01906 family)
MRSENTSFMNFIPIFFKVIGILAIPIILIGISFNLTVYDRELYLDLFTKYGVYSNLEGLDAEYMNNEVLDFLNHGADTSLKEFFTEREVNHMHDVKRLIDLGASIVHWALASLIISISYFIIYEFKNIKRATIEPSKILLYGSLATLTVSIILSLLFLFGFGGAFDNFHKTFFMEGSYSFNPSYEKIVVLYPENIFLDLAIRIFIFSVISSLILGLAAVGIIYGSKINEIFKKIRRH